MIVQNRFQKELSLCLVWIICAIGISDLSWARIHPSPSPVSDKINPTPGYRYLKSYDFSRIDTHALNAPETVTNSIDQLARYLTKPARNDRERTRAIFRWITENIDYDMEAYRNWKYGSANPENVLQNRQSVCGGYSNLFEELGKAAGLEVVTVSGYSKGHGYQVGKAISKQPNHAWNAVKLADGWYLIDSTWGAGHVNMEGDYERRFNAFYFLTPPEQFIHEHFPESSGWQLLDKALTRREFEDLAYLKSGYFTSGLTSSSHPKCIINAGRQLQMRFNAPEDTYLLASLYRNGRELTDAKIEITRKRSGIRVEISIPSRGEYLLRLFARTGDRYGEYRDVAEYLIQTL